MAKPFRYVGADARDYPSLGFSAVPGDIVYLTGLPPDERFVPHDAPVPVHAETDEPAEHGDEQAGADWRDPVAAETEDLKQPNKAASAEDWKAYAAAHGGFQEATGVHPDDATRKAIVDHYADPANAAPDQRTDTEREADEQADASRESATTDDASKEV